MRIPHAMGFVVLENFLRAQNSSRQERAGMLVETQTDFYDLFSQKLGYCPAAALYAAILFAVEFSSAFVGGFSGFRLGNREAPAGGAVW